MDKNDNIVNFPNQDNQNDSEHEEHKCDSCASYAIHELTHSFEDIEPEYIVEECLESIFSALENEEDPEVIVDAVFDLFQQSFDMGFRQHQKNMIHRLSGELYMMCAEPDGEEQ